MPYCIARPEHAKRADLYRVKAKPGGGYLGIIPDESLYAADRLTYAIRSDDVMVHLGDDPQYGKVYGVLVEPIRDRFAVRGWGTVYNFSPDLTDDMKTRIGRALISARQRVERSFPEGCRQELTTKVRMNVGKILGTYGYRPNGTDELTLRPPLAMGARELVKLIAHELGHGVWHRTMTPEQRARWIVHFGRYVSVKSVSVSDINAITRGMRQIESVKAYLSDGDPEDQLRAHIYLGWLSKVHGLEKSAVQDMLSAGAKLPIPDTHLHRSDVDTPITLYSKTSPVEMFCEALGSLAVDDLADARLRRMLNAR